MHDIKTVAVYCGSNTGQGDDYLRAASALGSELAARGLAIVYGGTHKGLMGALADAALAGGGHVTGVITERLKAKGHTHQGLNAVETLPTMQARKKRMIEMADAFVAMPGGIGTLEEFMEICKSVLQKETPLIKLPSPVFEAAGYLLEMYATFISRKAPPLTSQAARAASLGFNLDCSRAISELGYTCRPIEESIRDAFEWFEVEGYL